MQKTILIVEDDDDIRSFLSKLLIANNFKVKEASDGAIALEFVEKYLPDLVILDFGLPKVSGETVCVKIKQNHPEMIVIVVTEKTTSADVVHGLQIGADDYISKPFVAEELIARIDTRLKTSAPAEIVAPSPVTEQVNHIASIPEEESGVRKITLRESITLIIIRFIFTEIAFIILFFLLSILFSYLNSLTATIDLSALYIVVLTSGLAMNIMLIILIGLRWNSEYTEISSEGVIKHSGILHRKEQSYACNFVEGAKLYQSFFGLIFNYGTIELYDPALKEQVYLLNISNPKINSKKVQDIVSKEKNKPMPFIAPGDKEVPVT